MSRHTAGILAWTLVAVSIVTGLAGTALTVAVEGLGWRFFATDAVAIAIFLASAVVGALVASRLPANPIGWILLALVVALGPVGGLEGYIALSLDDDRVTGAVQWAALYSGDVWLFFLAALFLVLLLFPDGRLPTRRWRVVLWSGIAGLLISGVPVLLRPGAMEDYPRITSPIGVETDAVSWLAAPGFVLFSAALVGAAASLVVRFRRARGIERQQLTLLVAAGSFATTTFLASWFVASLSDDLANALTLVGILAIPVAIGVAMLRYRLYDVDRVISKTLVYGALTVLLGAAYAGLVLVGQALFSWFAGGSNLAIAVSTLVVAALFLPLRARVQRLVDRRFYRRRYDAQRTLESFGARLREQVQLETLSEDLCGAVAETMQPAHVALWLRREGARP
ncbi:MAG TPA: hypothetical protein VFR43_05350 [Gaiellaceae bacterium]|nr:hypothetical protein [Gaiellaceae bacterium]